MDMNDILAQWDQYQKDEKKKQIQANKNQVSHKKANAPTKQEKLEAQARKEESAFERELRTQNEQTVNPMEMWLRRYGVVDKDKIAEETVERKRENNRSYLLNMKCEATLDLHGLHQEEAYERLKWFIGDCKKRGLKKVMIIHGKGLHTVGTDPVLGEVVRKFIESDKRCGSSGHPKNKADGGSGATWILLK